MDKDIKRNFDEINTTMEQYLKYQELHNNMMIFALSILVFTLITILFMI